MDIFRILSRSTKFSKGAKGASNNIQTPKLPSSGEPNNPQLFGRDEAHTKSQDGVQQVNRGKKRKRIHNDGVEKTTLPPELDFFGTHGGGEKVAGGETVSKGKSTEKPSQVKQLRNGGEAHLTEEERLSEQECRKVLQLHKIKVTMLEVNRESEEKPSKKRKRRKESEEDPKKKNARQLYPQPLTSFEQLVSVYNIPRRLAENVTTQGYKVPTEVQLASLPLLLDVQNALKPRVKNASDFRRNSIFVPGDVDLLTIAPTGSGKTIAFLIPIITKIWQKNRLRKSEAEKETGSAGPRAIILAPTKELASQITNEGRKLAPRTGIKVTLMRKGMELVPRSIVNNGDNGDGAISNMSGSEQEDENESEKSHASVPIINVHGEEFNDQNLVKSHVLVATPLTLLHALQDGEDGPVLPLPTVDYLVLDEADVLLDPLFRDQSLAIWNACTNVDLRTSLWSATMGSSIEDIVKKTIRKNLSRSQLESQPSLLRLIVGLKDTALPNITHKLTYCGTEAGKLLALRQILRPTSTPSSSESTLVPPFLIFTQTIPRAQALYSELLYDIPATAGGSSRIAVLHSNLSDSQRADIMARFRRAELWILVTTDLLARGVDFRGVNGVVNFDVPTSAAAYVHRVGRTGRAGREGGVAVTLYTEIDIPVVKAVANVIAASEKARGKEGAERQSVPKWLLDALPTPTKREKQRLKKRGVEARREGKGGDEKDVRQRKRARISTKSGYERQLEERRRAAKEGSRRRRRMGVDLERHGELEDRRVGGDEEDEEDEFMGFAD
ncbi:P-loop containing nucleoside triphosphate hydrolase protein [Patellaria atrata CBS 101060]|uniref:ATP-dependent RNA helicase ROK1 n=1 Tax=Patellaria atrata CBS 101060 TaxID=1346257 RepID=A0A9P4SCC0_9PEZI|nr:P-loop containing nucleoside triphosphate hydrolase protein [Patellaria atrata CBS 101060]